MTPPLNHVAARCRMCGQEFDAVRVETLFGLFLAPNLCDTCVHEGESQRRDEMEREQLAALESVWAETCPPLYRSTELGRLPCAQGTVEAVMSWQFQPKGLLLHGESGSGKTRLMLQLLRRLHFTDRKRVRFLGAAGFGHQISSLFSRDPVEGAAFVRSLCSVDVLALDDLLKAKLSPRVESELFHVVEERSAWELPTFATTNGAAAQFRAALSQDIASPLIRRFRDFFTAIPVIGTSPTNL